MNPMDFEKMSDDELKREALALHDAIFGEIECFGTHDVFLLDAILHELKGRGIEVKRRTVLEFD
jgi:hypothetical protein